MSEHITKSLDTITIETIEGNGRHYVEVSHSTPYKSMPTVMFALGDEEAARKVLSMLSEIMGCGPVVKE